MASTLPPVIERVLFSSSVKPRSPQAVTVPSAMLMAVTACTASFPALMFTVPDRMETSSLEDFRPSAEEVTVTEAPSTSRVLLARMASASEVSSTSVFTTMVPPLSLMSSLERMAVFMLLVMFREPVLFLVTVISQSP